MGWDGADAGSRRAREREKRAGSRKTGWGGWRSRSRVVLAPPHQVDLGVERGLAARGVEDGLRLGLERALELREQLVAVRLEAHLLLRELGRMLELRSLERARLCLDRLRSTVVGRTWGVVGASTRWMCARTRCAAVVRDGATTMMIATRGVCVVWTPRRRDRRLRRPIDAENESARRRSPSKRTTRGNADTAPTEIYLKLLVVQRLEVRAGRKRRLGWGEWRQRVRLMRTRPEDAETVAVQNGANGDGRGQRAPPRYNGRSGRAGTSMAPSDTRRSG